MYFPKVSRSEKFVDSPSFVNYTKMCVTFLTFHPSSFPACTPTAYVSFLFLCWRFKRCILFTTNPTKLLKYSRKKKWKQTSTKTLQLSPFQLQKDPSFPYSLVSGESYLHFILFFKFWCSDSHLSAVLEKYFRCPILFMTSTYVQPTSRSTSFCQDNTPAS